MEEIKNSNEEINRKLREHFDGKIVRKDLTLSIKEGANVPVYVLEFLLGQYCSSEDENIIEEGVQTVKKILSDNFVRPDEAQKILSQLRKNGAYTVIDKVTVKLNIKKDRYEAEFSNLGLTEIVISPAFPEKYDRLLCGGIWCIVQLEYDNDLYEDAAQDLKKKKGNDVLPISIKQLTPIQMPHIEISELKEGRKAFTKDEWISVILRSVGMEPDKLSYREKWLILTRIIPLVENNFNLCELGPRSTGKSHLYKEVSPNSILVSGGQSTVANLFYNMSQRTVGLVGMWDCVAFDEVAGIKFKDKDGIQIMKDYMASGSFARGKEEKSASASMVFVGNINQDVEVLLKTSSLFDPFPPEMGTDTAFLDRIHCYLPGWEIPKFRPEHNNDVRAYRARNAYGDYVRKQKRNARESGIDRLAGTAQTVGEISRGEYGKLMTDAVVGSLAGEEAQNVINGIGTVGQAVSGSDSVGSTVLDVSSTLAAIEAKKLVKKLAETDIKKKKRAEERMKNHGNRFGIDKYDEVTGKNEKSKDTKKNADRHSEAPDKKQGSNKVGSSHKLQQEKQEYAKTQRAKEIKGKQKEIFIKENRKISNTLYSAASGKSQIFRRIFAKKGASLIVGGGVGAVVIPIFLVIIVFILMLAFFGWLSPFSYGLAGEDPDTEHNAETKAEVIDGYALMVKNYMDVTQA